MKYNVTLCQLLIVILVFILSYFLWGKLIAVSFLLGASVAIVPAVIFTLLYYKKTSICEPRLLLRKFYICEIVKILITIILFILVFQWKDLIPLAFFIGFSGFLLTQWVFMRI